MFASQLEETARPLPVTSSPCCATPSTVSTLLRVTSWCWLADALDLDAALNRRAAALADAGCDASLDIRRAVALGDLARGQDHIDGLDVTPGVTREVVLHVHTTGEAVEANTGPDGERDLTQTCRVETRGRKLLTLEQIRLWCAGAAKITIRPVIDLTTSIHVEAYEVPDRLSHQAEHRDITCRQEGAEPLVHPPSRPLRQRPRHPLRRRRTHQHRQHRAKLCRSHHRLKTHSGWTYHCLEPGTYLWRSPRGRQLLRGPAGSQPVS